MCRRQQSYSIALSKALVDGDVTDIAQGFQKVDEARRLSIFTVAYSFLFCDYKQPLISLGSGIKCPSSKEPYCVTGLGGYCFATRGSLVMLN